MVRNDLFFLPTAGIWHSAVMFFGVLFLMGSDSSLFANGQVSWINIGYHDIMKHMSPD